MLAVVAGIPALAGAAADDPNEAILYFFWGDGCPHCAEAEPVLEQWLEAYPGLEVRAREVWYDAAGQVEFAEVAERHGIVPRYVPTFFLGGQNWSGWSEQIEAQLSAAVEACLATGVPMRGRGRSATLLPPRSPRTPSRAMTRSTCRSSARSTWARCRVGDQV